MRGTAILAIDPGLSGAWAVFRPDCPPEVYDMPTVGKEVNPLPILEHVSAAITGPLAIVLEQAQSMPGQGVASSFRIGENYGALRGACLMAAAMRHGWAYHAVRPAVWKKALRLSKDKEASRQRALHLWPCLSPQLSRKRDEGRAEALLLGFYWEQTYEHGSELPTVAPDGRQGHCGTPSIPLGGAMAC